MTAISDTRNEVNAPETGENTKPERMFTQAEVDKLISDRLTRERRKTAQDTTIDKRETELSNRENALACREFVLNSGLPNALLDALDTSDAERFKAAVDLLRPHITSASKSAPTRTFSSSPSLSGGSVKGGQTDGIRKAFGLK